MSSKPSPQIRRLSSTESSKDPFITWSCSLKYSGFGGTMSGSGVILEFSTPYSKLQSCFPGLLKLKSQPETSYALFTCHHIIPDGSTSLQGWNIFVGPGKKPYRLDSLVCAAVSCCGEDGIISVSSNKSGVKVLLPHQTSCCKVKLDFTILLLNKNFEKQIVQKSNASARPLKIDIPSDSSDLSGLQRILHDLESTSSTEAGILQLCHREEGEVFFVIPVEIKHGLAAYSDTSAAHRLSDEVTVHQKLQKISYMCKSEASGEIVDGYSGSALVYYNPKTNDKHLVGIHVGIDKNSSETGWYTGITVCTILQLLSGNIAAFFALMEHLPARKMWPSRWKHLLTHTLEESQLQVRQRQHWRCLVEIIHLLLRKFKGTCLIKLDVQDPPEVTIAALYVLSAVFKSFKISGDADVAEAVSRVFTSDAQALEFKTNIKELCSSLSSLLTSALEDREEDREVAEAGFECYSMMLNLKYEEIVQSMLSVSVHLTHLDHLRQKYPSASIQQNFGDILLKWHPIMENENNTKMEQLKEELEKQKREMEDEHDLLKEEFEKQKRELEKQLQAVREELEQSKQETQERKNEYEVSEHVRIQQKLHLEKVEKELSEKNKTVLALNQSLAAARVKATESQNRISELSEEVRCLRLNSM